MHLRLCEVAWLYLYVLQICSEFNFFYLLIVLLLFCCPMYAFILLLFVCVLRIKHFLTSLRKKRSNKNIICFCLTTKMNCCVCLYIFCVFCCYCCVVLCVCVCVWARVYSPLRLIFRFVILLFLIKKFLNNTPFASKCSSKWTGQ